MRNWTWEIRYEILNIYHTYIYIYMCIYIHIYVTISLRLDVRNLNMRYWIWDIWYEMLDVRHEICITKHHKVALMWSWAFDMRYDIWHIEYPSRSITKGNPCGLLQPVSEKMRLEMVIGMQIEILDGHHRSLFKGLIWKETWTLTIEDFDLHFDEHFQSHLLGNGLWTWDCN